MTNLKLGTLIGDIEDRYGSNSRKISSSKGIIRDKLKDLISEQGTLDLIAKEVREEDRAPTLSEIRRRYRTSPFIPEEIYEKSRHSKNIMDKLNATDLEEDVTHRPDDIIHNFETLEKIIDTTTEARDFMKNVYRKITEKTSPNYTIKLRSLKDVIRSFSPGYNTQDNGRDLYEDTKELLKTRFMIEVYRNSSLHDDTKKIIQEAREELGPEIEEIKQDEETAERVFRGDHEKSVNRYSEKLEKSLREKGIVNMRLGNNLSMALGDLITYLSTDDDKIYDTIRERAGIPKSESTLRSEYIDSVENILDNLTKKTPIYDVEKETKNVVGNLRKTENLYDRVIKRIRRFFQKDIEEEFTIRKYDKSTKKMSIPEIEYAKDNLEDLTRLYEHTRRCLDKKVEKNDDLENVFETHNDAEFLLRSYALNTSLDDGQKIYALKTATEELLDKSEKVFIGIYEIIGDNRNYEFKNSKAKDFFRAGVMGRRGMNMIRDAREEMTRLYKEYEDVIEE